MGTLQHRWMDGECYKPTVVRIGNGSDLALAYGGGWYATCDAHEEHAHHGPDYLNRSFPTHAEAFAAAEVHARTHGSGR